MGNFHVALSALKLVRYIHYIDFLSDLDAWRIISYWYLFCSKLAICLLTQNSYHLSWKYIGTLVAKQIFSKRWIKAYGEENPTKSGPSCSGRHSGQQPCAPLNAGIGDDSDRFSSGEVVMIFSADGWGTSPSFAFPFIISAFIIMKRTPELIKVWANRVTGESGGYQRPGRPGKVSSRKDTNLTPNPINLILHETIWGSLIGVDWRI